jgi:alpha-acetolactate decarboxylase
VTPSIAHTLYQVSTATALVEGVYEGAVLIASVSADSRCAVARALKSIINGEAEALD